MARISVVVPARDAAATLERTLAALTRQTIEEPFEVVVVDDGSKDDTAALARGAPLDVVLIESGGVGSSAARNAGVAAASGEVLAFTDADCFPAPGWLAAGVEALNQADLVVGSAAPDESVPMGPFDRSLWIERETGLYETANLFMRRSLFERIGGFESWLADSGPRRGWTNPELGEDVWLGWRAKRTGARSAFEPLASVQHAVHPRGPLDYVRERQRLRHFPAMTRRMPELRDQFLHRRVFLSRKTLAFDAAVAGSAAALVARRPALAVAAALPYARLVAARTLPQRRRAPIAAAVELAADLTGLVALVRGSITSRCVVL
jgi:cellulose synthase/poly-beta-1,6-N-acetylglucosamine synthase-like glycosyltransferase